MKKILTALLLAAAFAACKKDSDNDPPVPDEPFTNPEGLWAGKAKLQGIDDSVYVSLIIPPDSNTEATLYYFNPLISMRYISPWQFDVNASGLTMKLDPSRSLQAVYDPLNKRFKCYYRKGTNSVGDFFLFKKEPLPVEGNYAGQYSQDPKTAPHLPYTLALNPNRTIRDNSGRTGNWGLNRDKSFDARLENEGEVSNGYFYRITALFDPATGILAGNWQDNKSGGGLLFLQKR